MKSISIFVLLLIILIAFPTSSLSSFLSDFQDPKSSLINAYASKSGNITMTLYSPGWLVYVDVSDHESEATDDNQDDSYGMKLALYTSQSFYTKAYGSCIDFYGLYCTNCVENISAPFSADYVQFSATGYMVQGYMYLDYTYWEIDDNQIGYATDCSSYTTMPYGNGGYGMIGLGMANGAQNNFLSSRVFSISLNSTSYNGNLVFESEYATFPSYTQVATLTTDNNWTISTIASIGVGLTELAVSTTVIFDINSDMIGLPTPVYNFLLKNFQKTTSTICSTSSSGPSCSYQGYIADLPNITLTVQDQKIPIPPQIYLKDYISYNSGNSLVTLTLNFKELNSSLVNESYVTPAYENYIILDSNFMAYYMTVFNGSGYDDGVFTVGLYASPLNIIPGPTPAPPEPASNSGSDDTWVYIVVGVVGFIILVGAVIFVVRVIRKKRAALLSDQTFLQGYSPEEPSVFEQNIPSSYQYNQYNQYIQYNVPPPQQMGYEQVYYTNQQQHQQQQYYPQVYENNQQQQNQYYVKNE